MILQKLFITLLISVLIKKTGYGAPGFIYIINSETNLSNISLKNKSQIYIDKQINKEKTSII